MTKERGIEGKGWRWKTKTSQGVGVSKPQHFASHVVTHVMVTRQHKLSHSAPSFDGMVQFPFTQAGGQSLSYKSSSFKL